MKPLVIETKHWKTIVRKLSILYTEKGIGVSGGHISECDQGG